MLQWAMPQCPPLGGMMWSVQTHWAVVKVRSVPNMHHAYIQCEAATGVFHCSSLACMIAVCCAARKVCRAMHCLSLNAASLLLLADAQRSRSKLGLIVGLTVSLGVPLLLLSLAALVLLSCRGQRGASFQHTQSASSVLTDELQVRPLLLPSCVWRLMSDGLLAGCRPMLAHQNHSIASFVFQKVDFE